jgi:hypothetical protein
MRHRLAAQSVIDELLERQSVVRPRSPIGRLFGRSPLDTDGRLWYAAASGEIAVAAALSALPAGWQVFHGLPVGMSGSDVNHLVVGPAGIFTIKTKRPGSRAVRVTGQYMTVGRRQKAYIPVTEWEADRVTDLLRIRMPMIAPVRPVIALVGTRAIRVRKQPRQVWVVAAEHLVTLLTTQPPALTVPEALELAAYIDRPASWHPRPVTVWANSPEIAVARFVALDAAVRSAHRRRLAWVCCGGAIVLASLITVAATLAPSLIGGLVSAFSGG